MTLIETVAAIRATNTPDADLQIARAVMGSFRGIPTRTPALEAANEETAQRIAPRMASIAGPNMAEELTRIIAELQEEARIVCNAFVSVLNEARRAKAA